MCRSEENSADAASVNALRQQVVQLQQELVQQRSDHAREIQDKEVISLACMMYHWALLMACLRFL